MNNIQVFKKIDNKYSEILFNDFESLLIKDILNQDFILKINEWYFCTKEENIKKYRSKLKIAKNINEIFEEMRKTLIYKGWSKKVDVYDFSYSYIKLIFNAIKVFGFSTKIVYIN